MRSKASHCARKCRPCLSRTVSPKVNWACTREPDRRDKAVQDPSGMACVCVCSTLSVRGARGKAHSAPERECGREPGGGRAHWARLEFVVMGCRDTDRPHGCVSLQPDQARRQGRRGMDGAGTVTQPVRETAGRGAALSTPRAAGRPHSRDHVPEERTDALESGTLTRKRRSYSTHAFREGVPI